MLLDVASGTETLAVAAGVFAEPQPPSPHCEEELQPEVIRVVLITNDGAVTVPVDETELTETSSPGVTVGAETDP